ncbi:MAG: NAD-dependent epimerase/dehydratase family protein [FCB group bacterium]|nr:NAD-dependent epimerase/dehydratase family protein [FCB group bacterium]
MLRKRYTYIQAVVDFIVFNLVTWFLAFVQPALGRLYGTGLLSNLMPGLIALMMVALLAVFRQYQLKRRDRFLRQFLSAFNVVTLGFLLIVVISFDLGALVASERGLLGLFLLGLLLATAVSRIITYLWMGSRPDFSLKEPVILKNGNGHNSTVDQPLILRSNLTIDEAISKIDESPFDFAVLTDEDGYFTGTVTDGDIIEAQLNDADKNKPIREIMNRSHPVARDSLTAIKMRQMMIDRNLRFLPLLNNVGKPVRVVLHSDLDPKYRNGKIENKLRRILIIGGAGYIGSIMVRYLLKRGYHVSVLDNLTFGYDALEGLDNHPAYRFYKGDARNIQDLMTSMKDVDAVVHLAAIVGDPACALDPRATIDINYEASKLLVDACLHKKVDRLLFASSCSVYGASENGELLTEESPLNPVSLYAETRLRSEEAILNRAVPPLAVTMFRLATVFGFSYRPRFDLVVNILTARALEDGEISIFGGSQWRPNVHVHDVVRAFVAGLEAPKENIDRQIFNLGSESQNYRISELGELVKEAVPGTKVKLVEAEMDKRDYKVGFDKIESMLNWKAGMTVRDGIQEIIDAHRNKKFGHYSKRIYSNLKQMQ